MNGNTPVYKEKNILEVSLRLFFNSIPSELKTMRTRQNAILLSHGRKSFPSKNIDKAALLREFSFPKKGKKLV